MCSANAARRSSTRPAGRSGNPRSTVETSVHGLKFGVWHADVAVCDPAIGVLHQILGTVWWTVSHKPLHTDDPHLKSHEPRDNLSPP
jgi:hypothetical protein